MKPMNGAVSVDGRPFARYAVEQAEPARDYGARWVVRIRPALDRQGEPGWVETYRQVRAAIHARRLDGYLAWRVSPTVSLRRAAVRRVDRREVVVRPGLVGRIPHDLRRTAVRNLVRAACRSTPP